MQNAALTSGGRRAVHPSAGICQATAAPRLHAPYIEAPLDYCELCDQPADAALFNCLLDRYILACSAHKQDAPRAAKEAGED